MSRLILLLSAACLLAGCALNRPAPEPLLLPPAEGPAPVLLKQTLAMESRGERLQFLVVGRFDHQRSRLAALMATGQPLMTLEYDGRQLRQQVNIPAELPARAILATIQLALWPADALSRYYPPEAGWALEMEANRRRLWHDGVPLLDVVHEGDSTRVINHLGEYSVTIQTLEERKLAQ
ncbi:DUF3261 domain-containing protein [Oceanimonas doudoroffii]|uniref:DUF3261 domain-containing protein n=1 Tax=Oceanimonas doudoroffii TaxID=84158 RepID=A0A233RCB4_9GAMM|nr:DUF3261 domain-containing protein [Oceanimonas doudoroffii]OXY81036.1 hypothetical protein B6S08_15055 [Oceanimonas doudoroffii]